VEKDLMMATIELQAVTKSFERPTFFTGGGGVNRRMMEGNADRAFTERVINQAEGEKVSHVASGGKIMALDHVNLTIPDGQTLAVVGPSGCGKSTLLRVVAGLDTDFEGKVLYDGQDMLNVPAKDRYIGMVFQSYALYPHFKGQGNLGFFFKVHKIDDKAAEERIRITSEIMGIGFAALLDRKPGTLSGGQQQRLAIGRAIVRNPRLFLFDEPLSNLDAKLRVQTRLEIKRLLHRFNITSIYVTHDQVEAIALSDMIVVMRAGKIEQVGEYAALRDNPVSSFVASFLGAPPMNLLAGGVVADGRLHIGEIDMPLPDDIKARVQTGQALTAGIRPEHIQLVSSSGAGVVRAAANGIHARGAVEMIEPDFAHQSQVVYIRSGELYFGLITALEMVVAGETVEVVIPTDQLYFFDTATEQRVA
jgi:ABC-type sugar transport system ATPase subunit